MIKQNIEINIEKGIIKSIFPIENGIRIIYDNKKVHYPDSFVLPSFTDSHCHVWGLGMKTLGLYLGDCLSAGQCLIKSLDSNFKRGNWLIGRGWNQELWGGILPDKTIIDKYYSDIPVCFIRIDGHSMWLNSKALEIAEIDENTKVEGGQIILDENNKPSGILIDNAMNLIEKVIPQFTDEQMEAFVISGLEEGKKSGIMKFHDMDVNLQSHKSYIKLDKEGKLNQRVYSFLSAQNEEYLNYEEMKYIGNNYKVQGIKLYADGALGSRGAALHDKYTDADSYGLELLSIDEMYRISKHGSELGFDIVIHAIGDKAVSNVIEVFRKLRNDGFTNNLRIEHSQLVRPQDIELYKKYSIIASVQPIHCVSDADMAEKRLGKDRAKEISYPWKKFVDNEIKLIAGSDFPIESENVLIGIEAFIKRILFNSNIPWNNEETISLDEALKAYIETPELIVGNSPPKIEVGNEADFLIIEGDINNIKSWKIRILS